MLWHQSHNCMVKGVLSFTNNAFSEFLLRLSSSPLVDLLLFYVHSLLVQLELLLVRTHPIEELSISRAKLWVEVAWLSTKHHPHLIIITKVEDMHILVVKIINNRIETLSHPHAHVRSFENALFCSNAISNFDKLWSIISTDKFTELLYTPLPPKVNLGWNLEYMAPFS